MEYIVEYFLACITYVDCVVLTKWRNKNVILCAVASYVCIVHSSVWHLSPLFIFANVYCVVFCIQQKKNGWIRKRKSCTRSSKDTTRLLFVVAKNLIHAIHISPINMLQIFDGIQSKMKHSYHPENVCSSIRYRYTQYLVHFKS